MKKIILILLSLILMLSGCSDTSYTEQDLIDSGYVLNENGNYKLEIGENGATIVIVDKQDNTPVGISAQVDVSNYQTIQLSYIFDKNEWEALYFLAENDGVAISPNDTYAYILAEAPDVVTEMSKFVKSENIPTSTLEDGDKTTIEKLVTNVISISNVSVTDSPYTNEHIEKDFVNNEYFVQVKFDITNDSESSINLDDWSQDICFETTTGTGCDELEIRAEGDTDISDQTLNPGDTISVQMLGVVPGDASNFYIVFETHEGDNYIESDTVN